MKKYFGVLAILFIIATHLNIYAAQTETSSTNHVLPDVLSLDERLELSGKILKMILKDNPINNKNAVTSATDNGILIKSNISLTLIRNSRMLLFEIFDLIKKAVKRPVHIYRKRLDKKIKCPTSYYSESIPYEYRYYLYWGDNDKVFKKVYSTEFKEHYYTCIFDKMGYWDIDRSLAGMYVKLAVARAKKNGITLARNQHPLGDMSRNDVYSYEKLHESEHGKKILRDIYKNLKYITDEEVYIEMSPEEPLDPNNLCMIPYEGAAKYYYEGLPGKKGTSVYRYMFYFGKRMSELPEKWIEIHL